MSDRTPDVTLKSDKTPEELALWNVERASKKARLASVLDRGMVGDRLSVDLPKDVYGEWVPNDKVEIHRYEALGFEVDKKYASSRSLHSDGAEGTSIVGDVIFMTCDMETKEIIEEIKKENYDKVNAPLKSKEERDFELNAKTSPTPAVITSSTSSVDATDIKNAVLQGT